MKRNNKGFTLAELLIVVAIIAVLVAVAIPTFGSQVERAREAADAANLRAAYAEATAAYLSGTNSGNATINATDKNVVTVSGLKFSQTDKWTTGNEPALPFNIDAPTSANTSIVFTFSDSGVSAVYGS